MMWCAPTRRRTGHGARRGPTQVGRYRAGPRWGLRGAAQACAGLGGCAGRGDRPGSAGHQPAALCWRRRGMAGQEHHSAGEGNGAGRCQRRMPRRPRQRANPPRAGGGPVTRHRTGAPAQCPHAPPCAIKPCGVTVATRRGRKRRTRTSQPATSAGNATRAGQQLTAMALPSGSLTGHPNALGRRVDGEGGSLPVSWRPACFHDAGTSGACGGGRHGQR
jgi:hypothetical protein